MVVEIVKEIGEEIGMIGIDEALLAEILMIIVMKEIEIIEKCDEIPEKDTAVILEIFTNVTPL
jgi:hypothetical protein